jgi:hypothetical protein
MPQNPNFKKRLLITSIIANVALLSLVIIFLGPLRGGFGASIIATNTVTAGAGAASGTITSSGNYDLVLQTGNATTGSITITDGTNGDINVAPDGTGSLVLTGADGTGEVLTSSGGSYNTDWSLAGGGTERRLIDSDLSISSGTQSAENIGQDTSLNYTGSAAQSGTGGAFTGAYGEKNAVVWQSTGVAEELIGSLDIVQVTNVANGTLTTAFGGMNMVVHQGSGTITNAKGGATTMVTSNASGAITNAIGYSVQWVDTTGGAVDVDNQTGLKVDALSIGDTQNIGLDIDSVTGATTNYAIRTAIGPILAGDAIYFTQTDGNERIDSASDGNLDFYATDDFQFNNAQGFDVGMKFVGTDSTGWLAWREDEDYFQFYDDILMNGNEKIRLRDTEIMIASEADGYFDLYADTAYRFRNSIDNTDIRFEFLGNSNSGLLEWREDEDDFNFSDDIRLTGSKIIGSQGSDVASTTSIDLGSDGNVFELTGTTNVHRVQSNNWQNGSVITLVANESVTVVHGTATSTTYVTIMLAGSVNFGMGANDSLTLMLSETTAGGQAWREISRTDI